MSNDRQLYPDQGAYRPSRNRNVGLSNQRTDFDAPWNRQGRPGHPARDSWHDSDPYRQNHNHRFEQGGLSGSRRQQRGAYGMNSSSEAYGQSDYAFGDERGYPDESFRDVNSQDNYRENATETDRNYDRQFTEFGGRSGGTPRYQRSAYDYGDRDDGATAQRSYNNGAEDSYRRGSFGGERMPWDGGRNSQGFDYRNADHDNYGYRQPRGSRPGGLNSPSMSNEQLGSGGGWYSFDDRGRSMDPGRGQSQQYGLGRQLQRGRPPKGYERSDDRLREDICEHLTHDHRIDASEVSVTVKSGVVMLEGTVSDRRQKHCIEDIADGCSGVKDVRNNIMVVREQDRSASQLSSLNEFGGQLGGQAGGEQQLGSAAARDASSKSGQDSSKIAKQ